MKRSFILSLLAVVLIVAGCGNAVNDAPGNTTANPSGENTTGANAGNNSSDDNTDTGAGSDVDPNSTLGKALAQGYITVGFANEAPYAYMDENGNLTGEAVEIARTALRALGIEDIRGELTEFGALIGGLQAGRFDMITAGMFINPNRCEAVLFADPEYSIGEAIAVKKGNPLNIKSYQDIADNDQVKVAVMAGAVEIGYLQAYGVPDSRIVITPDQDAAVSALQSGRADVMAMTGPALQSRLDAANDDNLERVQDFEQPIIDGKSVRGYGASAFRQADTEFRNAFNAELAKMKESGQLLDILEVFGFTEAELPGDMTAEQLCAG